VVMPKLLISMLALN